MRAAAMSGRRPTRSIDGVRRKTLRLQRSRRGPFDGERAVGALAHQRGERMLVEHDRLVCRGEVRLVCGMRACGQAKRGIVVEPDVDALLDELQRLACECRARSRGCRAAHKGGEIGIGRRDAGREHEARLLASSSGRRRVLLRGSNAARFLPQRSRSKLKLRPALPTSLKPFHTGKPRLLLGFSSVTEAFASIVGRSLAPAAWARPWALRKRAAAAARSGETGEALGDQVVQLRIAVRFHHPSPGHSTELAGKGLATKHNPPPHAGSAWGRGEARTHRRLSAA